MANALFDTARQAFLEGSINWIDGGTTIKACLVDTGAYTPNLSSHQYLSAVSGASAIVTNGRSPAFSGRTSTGGAADANDITFTSVSGASVEAIIIYIDTGVDATSQMIAYIDTATGLPITPNGGDIIVTWDNGANKIFKL